MSETEPILRLACRAMNTRFEIALWGRDPTYLTAAGEEALREVRALDQQLSFYRDDSDIRALNTYAARGPVTVEPHLFQLLTRAQELSHATEGAFDITVAPLLRAWGFTGEGGHLPGDEELQAARDVTGMDLVLLDSESRTVQFLRPGVMLDLGAIGKGYAVERAADLLRDAEVPGALLHGGTSSVYGLGTQPDGCDWRVAIRNPLDPDGILDTISLCDAALSVSGAHGKSFVAGDKRYGHVLDPRLGRPVRGALLAVLKCPSATDSDALSTALLTLGSGFFDTLPHICPQAGGLVLEQGEDGEPRLNRCNLP